jgi:hypothetical protein
MDVCAEKTLKLLTSLCLIATYKTVASTAPIMLALMLEYCLIEKPDSQFNSLLEVIRSKVAAM